MSDSREEKKKTDVDEKEITLLGLISEEPIHAYGIEEKIRSRQMDLWTEIGFSSIYRVLARLEENGLIEANLEHVGQGATRRVFTINENGRGVLSQGVLDRLSSVTPLKNPFCIGLVNITQAPYDLVLANLEERAVMLNDVEGELQDIERGFLARMDSEEQAEVKGGGKGDLRRRGRLTVKLIFDHTKRHIRAEREFVEDTIRFLTQEGDEAFLVT